MAMGAFLVGKRPVALMEGSGIGLSGADSRSRNCPKNPDDVDYRPQQHSWRALRLSWRDATWWRSRCSARSTFPTMCFSIPRDIRRVIVEAQATIEGQRIPVGILVPSHVIREIGESR